VIGKKIDVKSWRFQLNWKKIEKNDKDHDILNFKNEMFCIEKI
jgi:hypothetical protein